MGLSPDVQKKISEGGNTMYAIPGQQKRFLSEVFA